MTPWLVLGVALGGGAGAAARLVVDTWVKERAGSSYGLGTLVINVTGSFLLGLLTGLATRGLVDPAWKAVLGTGVCGGYTTFSTASLDTARLLTEGKAAPAAVHAVMMLVLSVLGATAGLLLGGA